MKNFLQLKKIVKLILVLIFLIVPALTQSKAYAHPSIPMYHLMQLELVGDDLRFTSTFSPDQIKAFLIFSNIDTNSNSNLESNEIEKWSTNYLSKIELKINNEIKSFKYVSSDTSTKTKSEFVDDPEMSLYSLIVIKGIYNIDSSKEFNEVNVINKNIIDGTDTYGFLPVYSEGNISIICQPMPEKNNFIFKYSLFEKAKDYSCDSSFATAKDISRPSEALKEQSLSYIIKDIVSNPLSIFIGLLICLLLGMQHALLPGHAKSLILVTSSTENKKYLKDNLLLASITSVSHGLSDILIAGLLIFTSEQLKLIINQNLINTIIGVITGLIIIIIGINYIIKSLKQKKSDELLGSNSITQLNKKEMILYGVISGLVPSLPAVGLLLYSYLINQFLLGLVLVIAYSLGFGIIIFSVAIGSRLIKKILKKSKLKNINKYGYLFGGVILIFAGFFSILQFYNI